MQASSLTGLTNLNTDATGGKSGNSSGINVSGISMTNGHDGKMKHNSPNNSFQTAIDKHRENTIRLFKESAERGESHVPGNKMKQIRNTYLSSARAASSMGYPKLISEMAEAEKEATSMYIQQIQRSKARAISSRVAAGSIAQTTQSNMNNNPSTSSTQTVLPKKKTE